jgi:hypothetical protein
LFSLPQPDHREKKKRKKSNEDDFFKKHCKELSWFCRSLEQRQNAEKWIVSKEKACSQCQICKASRTNLAKADGDPTSNVQFHLVFQWSIDFLSLSLKLQAVKFACDSCFKLMDLEGFLQTYSHPKTADLQQEAQELAQHFVTVNNLTASSLAEKLHKTQELYSAAYSLKVWAR